MEKTMFHSLVHSQKRFLFFQHHWKEHTLQTPHPVQQSGIWLCTLTGTVLLWVGWTTPPAFPATALATRFKRHQNPGARPNGLCTCSHTVFQASRFTCMGAGCSLTPRLQVPRLQGFSSKYRKSQTGTTAECCMNILVATAALCTETTLFRHSQS